MQFVFFEGANTLMQHAAKLDTVICVYFQYTAAAVWFNVTTASN